MQQIQKNTTSILNSVTYGWLDEGQHAADFAVIINYDFARLCELILCYTAS